MTTQPASLHGEVLNLRDVITFQGETVKELKQAFHDSVDNYLEFCEQRDESPEKPYPGKFIVRVEPELHKLITGPLLDDSPNGAAVMVEFFEEGLGLGFEPGRNLRS